MAEYKKLQSEIENLINSLPQSQSEALIFAKVQSDLKKLAQTLQVEITNIRVIRTTKLKDSIMGTEISFNVRGNPVNVLKFSKYIEDGNILRFLIIKKASLYINTYYWAGKKANTLNVSFYITALWIKKGEEKK